MSEDVNKMSVREKFYKLKMTEKELLYMIAKDTNRTAKNVAFLFWTSIISLVFLMVLYSESFRNVFA